MLAHIVQTRMTAPWIGAAERLVGMEWYSHVALHARPMSGLLEVEPTLIEAGREFVVRCRMRNMGFYPWSGTLQPRLVFDEAGKALALEQHSPAAETIAVYGDARTIEFRGVAPGTAGEARVTFTLEFPENLGQAVSKSVDLRWMAP
jgi:hypothetical protein